jgi:hypothetical protein
LHPVNVIPSFRVGKCQLVRGYSNDRPIFAVEL